MTELQIWRKARALLASGWCQNYSSRRKGIPVNWDDPTATEHCLTGAVYVARGGTVGTVSKPMVTITLPCRPSTADAQDWNDNPDRTQKQVLDAVDARIEELKR